MMHTSNKSLFENVGTVSTKLTSQLTTTLLESIHVSRPHREAWITVVFIWGLHEDATKRALGRQLCDKDLQKLEQAQL